MLRDMTKFMTTKLLVVFNVDFSLVNLKSRFVSDHRNILEKEKITIGLDYLVIIPD